MSDVGEPSELPLLLGSHDGEAETLLLIGAVDPVGRVRVRRWSGSDWSADREHALALLAWLKSQVAAGRSMNQSLYAVGLWLRGEGSGGR